MNSIETWREIFSVVWELLDLHFADDRLATLRKSPQDASRKEQQDAAMMQTISLLKEGSSKQEVGAKEHIEKSVHDSFEN